MARIRQAELPRDLFGERSRGVSLPDITWGDYRRVVRSVEEKYGSSVKRATLKLVKEALGEVNLGTETKVSLVVRKTLFVTTIVTKVERSKVSFLLSFDDLEGGTSQVRDKLLRILAKHARFSRELRVENGFLAGDIALLAEVIALPRRQGSTREKWPTPNGALSEEEISLLAASERRAHSG